MLAIRVLSRLLARDDDEHPVNPHLKLIGGRPVP
jgi:hypothetical protein